MQLVLDVCLGVLSSDRILSATKCANNLDMYGELLWQLPMDVKRKIDMIGHNGPSKELQNVMM